MNKIQLTVLYTNGSTRSFVGTHFQQGEQALTINTEQGTVVGIPNSKVDVYEVQQIQANPSSSEEQTGDVPVEPEVSAKDSAVEEEGDTAEEETS